MYSVSSAGSTEPSVPSSARSSDERTLWTNTTTFASRSCLQLRISALWHSAVAAS